MSAGGTIAEGRSASLHSDDTMPVRPRRLPGIALLGFLAVLPLALAAQPGPRPLFPVAKDGQWGYIDASGAIVITPQFDSADEFRDVLARAVSQGKVVFVDPSGQIVLRPEYQIVNEFSEGLAAVNNGEKRIPNLGLVSEPGRWGYIDKTGKLAIPMKFKHAEDFREGLAAVQEGDTSGFIDHTGKLRFPVPLDVTLGFSEGIVGAQVHGAVTYYDRNGRKLPTPGVDYGPSYHSFSEGLAAIATHGKAGYMDKSGNLVIGAMFEDAQDFREGLAAVKVPVDLIWCPAEATGSRQGSTRKYGYIDKTGKMVIAARFEYAGSFSEGLAAVSNCSRTGFIDKSGNLVIPMQFDEAFAFHHGLAQIREMQNGTFGYVDRTGKMIWAPSK